MGFIELGPFIANLQYKCICFVLFLFFFFIIKCLGSGQNVGTCKVGKPETHIFYLT